jgi:hypothetical protein
VVIRSVLILAINLIYSLKDIKNDFKGLNFVRGQGVVRFKSGAYTTVREHFAANRNAAIGQKIKL